MLVNNYASIFQEAVASAFELELGRLGNENSYFTALADELEPKRDFMAQFLREAGMNPVIPEGGYFMIADSSKLGELISMMKLRCT